MSSLEDLRASNIPLMSLKLISMCSGTSNWLATNLVWSTKHSFWRYQRFSHLEMRMSKPSFACGFGRFAEISALFLIYASYDHDSTSLLPKHVHMSHQKVFTGGWSHGSRSQAMIIKKVRIAKISGFRSEKSSLSQNLSYSEIIASFLM